VAARGWLVATIPLEAKTLDLRESKNIPDIVSMLNYPTEIERPEDCTIGTV
jgi:hypothetical protein